ncbi:hypothetical protein 3 [Hubei rhabdo-like virus 3]|uniref:Uncharacterized protein n=1 Tax=Hubei rhabdo-like virus 3 TaxID=1923187 RepID=A0A1L3KMT1_9MONO|nr:hypothetical protein 3 [Hubei rhabdo-like virus 3]APG78692.1 hypothetical protein 3 [Hubei rhabdo-like virus 3]
MFSFYRRSDGSPWSTIHFLYKVQDTGTGICYSGVVRIGEYKSSDTLPDHVLKDIVYKQIHQASIIMTDKLYLLVHFTQPADGKYSFLPRFEGNSFGIDLSDNLGVPRYFLNNCLLKVISFEIGCSSKITSTILS